MIILTNIIVIANQHHKLPRAAELENAATKNVTNPKTANTNPCVDGVINKNGISKNNTQITPAFLLNPSKKNHCKLHDLLMDDPVNLDCGHMLVPHQVISLELFRT